MSDGALPLPRPLPIESRMRTPIPLTRRTVLAGLIVASTLLASGCSADTGGADGATRTITDIEGTEVVVPEHPERVITLSEPTLDGALALGVTPIGAVTARGQATVAGYLPDSAQDIELLGGVAQPNYEAIGAAEPDLILVDGTSINNNAEAIAILRRIAPTVVAGYAGGDWRVTFGYVAEALGLAEQGDQVLADYDEHAAEVAAGLGAYADETFSIVRWQGGGPSLILTELPAGQALTDLGLRRPDGQDRAGRGHSEPVSLENIDAIDADYMFFGTLGGASVDAPTSSDSADEESAARALETAVATPGFTDLTAYRDGHVILVDGSLWTSTGGPLLMNGIVDAVSAALLGEDAP
jgi:iron complex transport system substrate-binding protein